MIMIKRISWFSLRYVLPVVIALLFAVIPPRMEHAYMPVVKDFSVLRMDVQADRVVMSGIMRKERNCTFLGVAATAIYVTGESDQMPIDTRLDASGNGGKNFTRATGSQAWGPWAVTLPVTPETVAIQLQLVHQCHWLWASQTDLGIIPLVRPKS